MRDLALPLIGRAITIREPRVGDLDAWYELETDADVKRYVGGPVVLPKHEWISAMGSRVETGELPTCVIALSTNGTFSGRVRLGQYSLLPTELEIQILIAKAHWGKGFGRDAAELLIKAGLNLLPTAAFIAVIHPENEASRNLVSAFGFQRVGRKTTDGWDAGHHVYRLAPGSCTTSAIK